MFASWHFIPCWIALQMFKAGVIRSKLYFCGLTNPVLQYLVMKPAMNMAGGDTLPFHSVRGEVVFNNVCFTYPSRPDQVTMYHQPLRHCKSYNSGMHSQKLVTNQCLTYGSILSSNICAPITLTLRLLNTLLPRYIAMFGVQVGLPHCKWNRCKCTVLPVHDFPYIIARVFVTKITHTLTLS